MRNAVYVAVTIAFLATGFIALFAFFLFAFKWILEVLGLAFEHIVILAFITAFIFFVLLLTLTLAAIEADTW